MSSSSVSIPQSAARAHRMARFLCMSAVSINDANSPLVSPGEAMSCVSTREAKSPIRTGEAKSQKIKDGRKPRAFMMRHSRRIDLCSKAGIAFICIARIYMMFRHDSVLNVSERLVRSTESAISITIAVGAVVTGSRRFEQTARFVRCIMALNRTGVKTPAEEMDKSFRIIIIMFIITIIFIIIDIPMHMFRFSFGVLAVFSLTDTLFVMKMAITMLFVFYLRWLNTAMTATIECCKRECEEGALAAVRHAAVRHRLLRAAQARLCRAFELPIAFTLLCIYLHTTMYFYHLAVDIERPLLWQVSNAFWIPHNYIMLHLMVQPCHVFRKQDNELVEIVSVTLQRVKRGSIPASELLEVDIMWERVAIARLYRVEFKMMQAIDISRGLFLSITSTMLTFIVVLVHIKSNK